MRRRTSKKKNRLLIKLLRSSLFLLKTAFKTIAIVFIRLIEYILCEAILWFVTLGGLASLLVMFGIPQNMASLLAIAINLGLFIIAVYISCKYYEEKKLTRNKRKDETRAAYSIAKTFANSSPSEWQEYQDWLHDIMLSRQQLLDANCPRWQIKLITYKRLSAFCIVVGISRIKQATTEVWRSR